MSTRIYYLILILHCKINTQQKFLNSELLGVYHQIICGFGKH